MKICSLSLLSLVALASFAYPIEELICPDSDPENCYPKSFKPTTEWQVVKEGQEIPPGLHIRFNMETESREAKLLDSSEVSDSRLVQVAEVAAEVEPQQQQQLYSHKPNKRISSEDKSEFSSSVFKLQQFVLSPGSTSLDVVFESLASLEELSHDLDFGIRISNPDTFSTLLQLSFILPSDTLDKALLSVTDSEKIKDLSLRIIAATLRNNPIALQNALKSNQKPSFVINSLLNKLSLTSSAVIQKRVLGVLTGYLQTSEGIHLFNLNDGQNKVLIAFNQLSNDGKVRALQILDDLNGNSILKRSEDGSEHDLTQDDIDTKIFTILKDRLINDPNHHDFKKLFLQLVDFKQNSNTNLKVDSEFLNWLTNEIERRGADPELVKRDNEDNEHGEDESFHKYMLRQRHVVFGNPMGYRKAVADEL